jgi:hypothetical protein
MIRCLADGVLESDPQEHEGSPRPFVTATMRTTTDPRRGESAPLGLFAVGDAAARLLQMRTGDVLAVAGTLRQTEFLRAGRVRRGWRVHVREIIGVSGAGAGERAASTE